MDSIAPECNNFKHAYEQCFNDWFERKFIKAHSVAETKIPSSCQELYEKYHGCITKKIEPELLDMIRLGRL